MHLIPMACKYVALPPSPHGSASPRVMAFRKRNTSRADKLTLLRLDPKILFPGVRYFDFKAVVALPATMAANDAHA
jgi:hypothetical protein